MTAPAQIAALADRVEKLDAPKWDVFYDAFGAIYGTPITQHPKGADLISFINVGAWLDAAVTLVPEGYTWTIYADGCAGVSKKLDEDDLADGDVWAATPALALVAAALRAHASQEPTDGE